MDMRGAGVELCLGLDVPGWAELADGSEIERFFFGAVFTVSWSSENTAVLRSVSGFL